MLRKLKSKLRHVRHRLRQLLELLRLASRGRRFIHPAPIRQEPQHSASSTLFFLHIPKTAGTSLLHCLDGLAVHFKEESHRIPVRSHKPPVFISAGWQGAWHEVIQYLGTSEGRPARFLSAHCPYGVHEVLQGPCQYISVLREPVAREVSSFNHHYERGFLSDSDSLLGLLDSGRLMDNPQTRMLAGAESCLKERCSERDYELALEHIEGFFLLGVQERFDEFLSALCALQGWPAISFFPQRVTEKKLILAADETSRQRLEAFHHFDVLLHAQVRAQWDAWYAKTLRESPENQKQGPMLEIPWHFPASRRVLFRT